MIGSMQASRWSHTVGYLHSFARTSILLRKKCSELRTHAFRWLELSEPRSWTCLCLPLHLESWSTVLVVRHHRKPEHVLIVSRWIVWWTDWCFLFGVLSSLLLLEHILFLQSRTCVQQTIANSFSSLSYFAYFCIYTGYMRGETAIVSPPMTALSPFCAKKIAGFAAFCDLPDHFPLVQVEVSQDSCPVILALQIRNDRICHATLWPIVGSKTAPI